MRVFADRSSVPRLHLSKSRNVPWLRSAVFLPFSLLSNLKFCTKDFRPPVNSEMSCQTWQLLPTRSPGTCSNKNQWCNSGCNDTSWVVTGNRLHKC